MRIFLCLTLLLIGLVACDQPEPTWSPGVESASGGSGLVAAEFLVSGDGDLHSVRLRNLGEKSLCIRSDQLAPNSDNFHLFSREGGVMVGPRISTEIASHQVSGIELGPPFYVIPGAEHRDFPYYLGDAGVPLGMYSYELKLSFLVCEDLLNILDRNADPESVIKHASFKGSIRIMHLFGE